MKVLRGLDLKRARLVPSSVFASPEDVIRHDGLSTVQKLAILRRWEFDARRTAGFAGAEAGARDMGMLFRVRRALQSLSADGGVGCQKPLAVEPRFGRTAPEDDAVVVASSVLASRNLSSKH